MASVRFSVRARDDLRDIVRFTIRRWGEAQAERYLAELEDYARLLADTPASTDTAIRSDQACAVPRSAATFYSSAAKQTGSWCVACCTSGCCPSLTRSTTMTSPRDAAMGPLAFPSRDSASPAGRIERRQRLGGLLNFYGRKAA